MIIMVKDPIKNCNGWRWKFSWTLVWNTQLVTKVIVRQMKNDITIIERGVWLCFKKIVGGLLLFVPHVNFWLSKFCFAKNKLRSDKTIMDKYIRLREWVKIKAPLNVSRYWGRCQQFCLTSQTSAWQVSSIKQMSKLQ